MKIGSRPEPFFGPEDWDGVTEPQIQSDDRDQKITEWDAAWAKLTLWQKFKELFA